MNKLLLFFIAGAAQAAGPIVIDPGHGGSDTGAVVRHPKTGATIFAEKDATLKLAQEVARQLRTKGITTLLTREDDRELALNARTAFANQNKAQLFLSLHLNSSMTGGGKAEGVETYILNSTTDETARRLAHFENTGRSANKGSGEELPPEVGLILKDLKLDANLPESKRFGCLLQENLVQVTKPMASKNRGVKQALFYVLLGADMPSALVEAGFVNSPKDRSLYLNPYGLRALAAGVVRAITGFRSSQSISTCQVR